MSSDISIDEVGRTPSTAGQRHVHQGLELLLVHSGVVVLSVGDGLEVLCAGDAAIFRGTTIHGGRTIGGDYTRSVIYLPSATTHSVCPSSAANRHIEPLYASIPGIRGRASEARLLALARGSTPAMDARNLLAGLLPTLQLEPHPKRMVLHPVVQDVVTYMVRHVEGSESVDDLARRFYISPSRLYALFRTNLRYSPYRLWLTLKIEQACSKMVLVEPSVNSLGDYLGFGTRRGFERAFRRVTGQSPVSYLGSAFMEGTVLLPGFLRDAPRNTAAPAPIWG